MKPAEAVKTVLRAAEAHANGHEHCRKIFEAVAVLREMFAMKKKKR